jgi:hypothetical protein
MWMGHGRYYLFNTLLMLTYLPLFSDRFGIPKVREILTNFERERERAKKINK